MSNYSQFFLNSKSSIIQLELLEISHAAFTKTYRIVRNAIAGVTVTLEDTTVQVFDYYPVKIVPTGASDDLDQTLQLTFGDLGQIIPQELDRLLFVFKQPPLFIDSLFGVWVDGSGIIVASPFQIGTGCNIYVPPNAVYLSMGCNGGFANSHEWFVTVNDGVTTTTVGVWGWSRPWDPTINTAYPYPHSGSIAGTLFPVSVGALLKLTTSGTGGNSNNTGNGNPTLPAASTPGIYPSTYVTPTYPQALKKPLMKYRTYRSDDLTTPLYGPLIFEIDNTSFKKEGASMLCSAHRLNTTATGEIYSMDRFPMLRGFLV